MNTIVYDGSFESLLSAVFEIYEYKITDPFIKKKETTEGDLFGSVHETELNGVKSARVLQKLKQKLTPNALSNLYRAFLSEERDIENVLYRYIAYVLREKGNVENNYGNADVMHIQQVSRKVHREKHRMEAFVRFQLTKDELYYCIVQPDYNVLPLISNHFEKRYADQRWLIYDGKRKYGIYYDLKNVSEINLTFHADTNNREAQKAICDEHEPLWQTLWQQYFSSVNIAARKNTKLHIQHMPKRYWKYLPEKRGSINGEY